MKGKHLKLTILIIFHRINTRIINFKTLKLRSLRNFFIGEYVFVKIITNSQCVHNKNYL